MNNTTTSDFFKPLEKQLSNQTLRFAVQKAIFCPYSNDILDYRTAILIEQYKGEELKGMAIISPKFKDKVNDIKSVFEQMGYRVQVITYQK